MQLPCNLHPFWHERKVSSPANFAKHEANLKVGSIIAKMMVKVNGGSQ